MAIRKLFPTLLYQASLRHRAGWRGFNNRLLRESRQLRQEDTAGRLWSEQNYPGGYTSYDSVSRMHRMSPTFAKLQQCIDPHVRAFAQSLDFDLRRRPLEMTDCWVNIMDRPAAHGLHLHPLSTISGAYYVRTPVRCAGLKLEDPRLDRFMAAPPRRGSRGSQQSWILVPAAAGTILLFESWLRHEVPSQPAATDRISISFNYSWF